MIGLNRYSEGFQQDYWETVEKKLFPSKEEKEAEQKLILDSCRKFLPDDFFDSETPSLKELVLAPFKKLKEAKSYIEHTSKGQMRKECFDPRSKNKSQINDLYFKIYEAFDKVARAIGLGYPGGPKIDKLAKEGDPEAIEFPRAAIAGAEYDFSFSGLKSSVLNYINSCEMKGIRYNRANIAASFQKAVVDVLVAHSMKALKNTGWNKFAIAGGVASNSAVRKAFTEICQKEKIDFYYPSPVYCTDNAAMIGAAAYYEFIKGTTHGYDLNAVPNLKLGERI